MKSWYSVYETFDRSAGWRRKTEALKLGKWLSKVRVTIRDGKQEVAASCIVEGAHWRKKKRKESKNTFPVSEWQLFSAIPSKHGEVVIRTMQVGTLGTLVQEVTRKKGKLSVALDFIEGWFLDSKRSLKDAN